jgi:hypothetical protein
LRYIGGKVSTVALSDRDGDASPPVVHVTNVRAVSSV